MATWISQDLVRISQEMIVKMLGDGLTGLTARWLPQMAGRGCWLLAGGPFPITWTCPQDCLSALTIGRGLPPVRVTQERARRKPSVLYYLSLKVPPSFLNILLVSQASPFQYGRGTQSKCHWGHLGGQLPQASLRPQFCESVSAGGSSC